LRGLTGNHYDIGSDQEHLEKAITWLCAAQDATPDDGVSAFYDIRAGEWGPSYPETTGYIIPTFFDYAKSQEDETIRARAIRMAGWILTLQLENGAFPIGPLWPTWERAPLIFDTGQIIFGLVRAFKETDNPKYLAAAQRAGDWLIAVQHNDGSWHRFTSLEKVHAYNVRVAWALLQISQVSQERKYQEAAINNVNWTLSQQTEAGWFNHMNFKPGEEPLTHTIAYTIRGILESGLLLGDQNMISKARISADALIERQQQERYLHARYSSNWKSQTKYICPTGTAQIAIIWLRLYTLTSESKYLEAAEVAIEHLKQMQPRNSKLSGVLGGLAGSYPIYGDYEPYRHLNWAVKFFADSLILVDQLREK